MTTSFKQQSSFFPMLLIGILFFVFGFVTWLNGALIPFLKIVCELNEFQALLVAFAFYIAYVVMALPMSVLLNRFGYKHGMTIGLGIMVLGSVLFIPAAQSAHYAFFLLALFVLGTGLTILQTAANPYIVCIGPRESAAMRISIMGIVNKGAGFIVPLIFAAWILTGMEQYTEEAMALLTPEQQAIELQALSNRLVVPYLYMTAALLGLMAFVHFSRLPEPDLSEPEPAADAVTTLVAETEQAAMTTKSMESDWRAIWRHPQLVLGFIALFFYVGVEVIAGDSIGLYGQGLGVAHFGVLTSYTMAFMVAGYLLGVLLIPRYLSQSSALLGSALAGLVFTLGILLSSTEQSVLSDWTLSLVGIPAVPDSVLFVALLGFANALVWPAVWPLALQGLGRLTATGSALLIMGIAGGALLPLVYGYLAHSSGNSQSAYWMLLPCYAFILFYAVKGHKIKQW
ncbi:sugar MFS transporter [Alkalimonas delamerensis]|uniref:Sugar MFS transporter n=1 Tax=Alkalimonas delamerensis TaxID=265981 RepID=A0ABT9GRB0_9GAMM|nr:sugar MFS transporter [Alkalimonas delamerensis]MDP4529498.1 sugar MFS transporter [Alkalimonas delamerensis]